MSYYIVTDGQRFGTLELGKPMPKQFWRVGPMCATKDEAQEWVWAHVEALEAIC